MGRSRRSFNRILKGYKYKDLVTRMTRVPVLREIGKRVVDADSVTLTYLPICEDLELPPGTVAPTSVIEHFINEASNHLILSVCPCRTGNDCKDFDPDFGCTFLGPAVLDVDPEVGRQVTKEEALEHLHKATEAGLVSCIGKFKFDAIMMGVARDHHRLITICHCCPCCCLSTSIPYASREARDLLVKLEGVNVEVTEKCNGCGLCVDMCLFKQISIEDGKAVIGEECKGCGRCSSTCRRGGVRIWVDNPAYFEECIERIGSRVQLK